MLMKFAPFRTSEVWEFIDPDTGHKYKAVDRRGLIREIVQYRANNNLDALERLDVVIDNYLCGLPVNSGACVAREPLNRSLLATLKGGIVVLENLLYSKMVTQETANRRAKQCSTCKFNVNPDKSRFEAWCDDIAERMTGGKQTPYQYNLFNCEVCSCPVRAKVWYGGTVTLTKEQELQMQTVDCWQLGIQKKKHEQGH